MAHVRFSQCGYSASRDIVRAVLECGHPFGDRYASVAVWAGRFPVQRCEARCESAGFGSYPSSPAISRIRSAVLHGIRGLPRKASDTVETSTLAAVAMVRSVTRWGISLKHNLVCGGVNSLTRPLVARLRMMANHYRLGCAKDGSSVSTLNGT